MFSPCIVMQHYSLHSSFRSIGMNVINYSIVSPVFFNFFISNYLTKASVIFKYAVNSNGEQIELRSSSLRNRNTLTWKRSLLPLSLCRYAGSSEYRGSSVYQQCRFLPFLRDHLALADTQDGFREQRFTTSALLLLSHSIAVGFNHAEEAP